MIRSACFLIAILVCTLLFACSRDKEAIRELPETVPADSIISSDKMVLILADVHVVEAALVLERRNGQELKEKADFYYQGVFRKYHISQARYDQNLRFYRQNPENFAKMYERVMSVIESRQKHLSGSK